MSVFSMHHPIPTPPAVMKLFQAISGVGIIALFAGFSVCLFDLDKVPACVDYAIYATEVLQKVGEHIVQWFILVLQEVFRRY